MQQSHEKRRSRRKTVDWPASLLGAGDERRARCVDASLGGVSLVLEDGRQRPALGARCTVIIEARGRDKIFVEAQVVRVGGLQLGLRVPRLTPGALELLHSVA